MLLRQIEYFQSVVEKGNFYLAAEACHISQSAISQQIKKLEDELGVELIKRHNRTFSLTRAGEHFYHKSLIITSDVEQLLRETKRLGGNEKATLSIGYYNGYFGRELLKAVEEFSEKYPTVDIQIMSGSHEKLYEALENGSADLVLNDQRRAFSNAYNNLVLFESEINIEISSKSPLAKLNQIEINDLKNIPCILVADAKAQKEEEKYYEKIVGLKGDFIFARSVRDARLKIVTGQGYMPVDAVPKSEWFDMSVSRIPLIRNSQPITKAYCAFWKKDNSGYYVEEFADMLKDKF